MPVGTRQPDRGEIVKAIERYGDDEIGQNGLQRLRDREPAFDVHGIKPKLFTDMYLFDLFLHDRMERSKRREGGVAAAGGDGESKKEDEKGEVIARSTLPPFVLTWEEEEARARNGGKDRDGRSRDGTLTASATSGDHFRLIENMRSVTQVPRTREWLCLDQALFDAHFKLSLTSQSMRMDGSPEDEFKPLPGAHFQGDCKSKMMQLLYDDVIRAIMEMKDVRS